MNARLKRIQDEEGAIKAERLRELSLSSPDSSVSLGPVLPTPPMLEDQSSSRYSIPSGQQPRPGTSNNERNEQSFVTSGGSPQPIFQQIKGLVGKKQKQAMISSRLGLFKSFQPQGEHPPASASKLRKKHDLFRSNVEEPGLALLAGFAQNFQLSHKDYLDESIRSSSHDEESVAEERVSLTAVHPSKPNPHQSLNSQLASHRPADEGMEFAGAESYCNEESKDSASAEQASR